MVMNNNCTAMAQTNTSAPDFNPNLHHVDEVLRRPIGVCTTNVIGSSVIFECKGDYINEKVYIDATQGNAPTEPDCSGDLLYNMPIYNGCNTYEWGDMLAVWDGYC